MKAIKIPNANLLDVFGKPAAINSHDLYQRSTSSHTNDNQGKDENSGPGDGNVSHKVDPSQQLSVIGETPLHIAIMYNDIKSVKLLVSHGIDVNKRIECDYSVSRHKKEKEKTALSKFGLGFLFSGSSSSKAFNPQTEDPETHAYYGEYPLAFAAAFDQTEIYDFLIDHGADPNLQDSYGNTVLHMLIIRDGMTMFKHAVRNPNKKVRLDIQNNSGLTPLTLAAKLGRKELFLECLELSHVEIWRYSNIKCCTYPLRGIDTIKDGGEIDWNSSLMSIVNGKTENHLDMLDNMVIERLLNDKWSSFARVNFVRQLILLCVHLIFLTTAIFLRNPKDDQPLAQKIICHIAEACVIIGCMLSIFVLQAKEIYIQGFNYYLQNLKSYPEKFLYQCSCILILLAVPFRILYLITDNVNYGYVEDGLVSLAIPGTFLFFLFFGRIYALTGAFIVMIFEMITGDIATFGVIYVIVITAFGQVFYLLFRDTTEGGYCERATGNETCGNDNMCSFKNFEAWMTMVHFTMGEFDFSRFDLTHYSYLVKTLFIIFMILTPILLLNMLIASMGNTYQRVISISEKERIRQWAQLVLTIERSCSPKQRFDYQGVYAIGADDKRDLMVIKRASKTKAAQRKGAFSNWKHMGRLVLYLLKEQNATAENVRLRRVSHQSAIHKTTAQLNNMIETLAWERDMDISAAKGTSASNQNLNLGSTHNTSELNQTMSRPGTPLQTVPSSRAPSPPPPQFLIGQYPIPSSIPQCLTGDRKPVQRSEWSELRARPSFIDYEDLEMFRRKLPLTRASHVWHAQPVRRTSMMPVDAEGYRDLLLDIDHRFESRSRSKKKAQPWSRDTSVSSIRSKTSETTIC